MDSLSMAGPVSPVPDAMESRQNGTVDIMTFPSFSLHGELRNPIYRFCSLFTAPMSFFQGLLLISKQFSEEYRAELGRLTFALEQNVRMIDQEISRINNKSSCSWFCSPYTPLQSLARLSIVHIKIQLPFFTPDEGASQVNQHQGQLGATRPEFTASLNNLVNLSIHEVTIVLVLDNLPNNMRAHAERVLFNPFRAIEKLPHISDVTRQAFGPRFLHIGWQLEWPDTPRNRRPEGLMACMHAFWKIQVADFRCQWILRRTWREESGHTPYQLTIWSELGEIRGQDEWKYRFF